MLSNTTTQLLLSVFEVKDYYISANCMDSLFRNELYRIFAYFGLEGTRRVFLYVNTGISSYNGSDTILIIFWCSPVYPIDHATCFEQSN